MSLFLPKDTRMIYLILETDFGFVISHVSLKRFHCTPMAQNIVVVVISSELSAFLDRLQKQSLSTYVFVSVKCRLVLSLSWESSEEPLSDHTLIYNKNQK
jgi:hypothetical protein